MEEKFQNNLRVKNRKWKSTAKASRQEAKNTEKSKGGLERRDIEFFRKTD